jgi:hypothetical protein
MRLSGLIKMILLLGMIASFPAIGMILGGAYYLYMDTGSSVDWQALDRPPAGVIGLVDGDLEGVYVLVRPASVYYCQTGYTPDEPECWIEVTPPAPPGDDPYEISPPDFRVKPPPGDEIERIRYGYRFEHGAVRVDYVLQADGSIWEWRFGSSAQTMLFYGFIGLIAGTALAVVISITIVMAEIQKGKRMAKTSK